MFFVGEPKIIARRLVEVTYESMMRRIEVVKPGATLGDIGHAIHYFAEKQRFAVVSDFCGHSLDPVFHDAPTVLHYSRPTAGLNLRTGLFFTNRHHLTSRPPGGNHLQ